MKYTVLSLYKSTQVLWLTSLVVVLSDYYIRFFSISICPVSRAMYMIKQCDNSLACSLDF
jgi:hypothetical protein